MRPLAAPTLSLALIALACGGTSDNSNLDEVELVEVEAEVVDAGPLCPEDLEPVAQQRHPLGDGRTLLEVTCEMYAYQGRIFFWLETSAGRRPTTADGPLELLGLPSFDPDTRTLSNLERYRGPGDCGVWTVHRLEGDYLVLQEKRARDCDDASAEEPPPPQEWPLVSGG